MTSKKRIVALAAVLVITGIIIGLAISSNFNFQSDGYTSDVAISQEAIDILSKTNHAITEVAAAVKPSVVNISSTKTIRVPGMSLPFFNDPFFKRFFGDEFGFSRGPKEFKQSGLGSGVIVDKNGYILTNNHVIRGADEIKVKLPDNRDFKGKVIGTDPKTDLAVVKIDADDLPVIKFGDSDKLKVGEMVLAIGNPFGLNQTVTTGIVSATGRANVGVADYEDFIQTDAAINPGNSGGALVNIRGELIGINTAIFSTTGGYQGIGFSIPSNMAKSVMKSLIKEGKVVRGWFGISIQEITPELAKQFGLEHEKGVLVGDVIEDSPAEKAGIQRGDVIIEYNGREVKDVTGLRNMVSSTLPGKEVIIKIIRDRREKTARIKISEMPEEMQKIAGEYENLLNGVHVQNIDPMTRKELGIPEKIRGVIVTDVEPGSPAFHILGKGDVIIEINRKSIRNVNDYSSIVSSIPSGENILLLIYRNGSTIYLTLSKG